MPLVNPQNKTKQTPSTPKEIIKADRGNPANTRVSAKKITEAQRTAVKTAVADTVPPTQRKKNAPEPAAANAAQRRSKLFMDAMKEAGAELKESTPLTPIVDKLVNKFNKVLPAEITPAQQQLTHSLLSATVRTTEAALAAPAQKFVSIDNIAMPATMKQIANQNPNASRAAPISIDSFLGNKPTNTNKR